MLMVALLSPILVYPDKSWPQWFSISNPALLWSGAQHTTKQLKGAILIWNWSMESTLVVAAHSWPNLSVLSRTLTLGSNLPARGRGEFQFIQDPVHWLQPHRAINSSYSRSGLGYGIFETTNNFDGGLLCTVMGCMGFSKLNVFT